MPILLFVLRLFSPSAPDFAHPPLRSATVFPLLGARLCPSSSSAHPPLRSATPHPPAPLLLLFALANDSGCFGIFYFGWHYRNTGGNIAGDITVGSVAEIGKVDIDTGIAVGTVSINGAPTDSCTDGSSVDGNGVKAKSISVRAGKGKKFGNVAAVKVFGLRSVDSVTVDADPGNSIADFTVVGDNSGLTIKEVSVSAGSGSHLGNVALRRVVSVTKQVVVDVHANVSTYYGLVLGGMRLPAKQLVLAAGKDCEGHDNDDCQPNVDADGGDCDGGLIQASDKACIAQGGDACTMTAPDYVTTTVAAATTTATQNDATTVVAAASTTTAAIPTETTTEGERCCLQPGFCPPCAMVRSSTTGAATTTAEAATTAGATIATDAAETTPSVGITAEPLVGELSDNPEPDGNDAGNATTEPGVYEVLDVLGGLGVWDEGPDDGADEGVWDRMAAASQSSSMADTADPGAGDDAGTTPTDDPEETEDAAAAAADADTDTDELARSEAECNAALVERTGDLCMNGGVCEFKRADCNNADLPFDTPVCACPTVRFGTCFYGQHCQMKVDGCSSDTQSCNVIRSLKSNVDPTTAVCSTDEWPARLCTAAQPPALAGASSVQLLEVVENAPADKSSAGGAVAAVLVLAVAAVLLGMYHRKRQVAEDEGGKDGTAGNADKLDPFGSKTLMTSVENPMYSEQAAGDNPEYMWPTSSASPDYLAPTPVGGAEPVYAMEDGGGEPVYDVGDGDGDAGYLAVGDGVESMYADAMYDLAGNTQGLLERAAAAPVGETEAQRLHRLGMENGLERDHKTHTFTLEKPLRAMDDATFDVEAEKKKKRASMKKSKKSKKKKSASQKKPEETKKPGKSTA